VILWGKTKDGKRRWWCKNCQRSFVWKKEKSGHKRWMTDWISGLIVAQIAVKYRKSASTIQREINELLSGPPGIEIKPNKEAHLLVDGTYFKRQNCLTVYFDDNLKYFQLCRYSKNENKDEIEKDFRMLKRAGVIISSVTADGKNAVKSALKKVFPSAKFQRCLVHIQRYAETYITQRPKTTAGIELKEIVSTINQIDDELSRMTFVGKIDDWKRRHHNFLKERTTNEEGHGWWYTHRNLRRVVYHIDHALPDMFHYLNDPKTPKDTNGLEGRFTDLKHKFRTHKGLRKTRRENYLKWYIFTKNLNKKR
jgi:hypothetical protein